MENDNAAESLNQPLADEEQGLEPSSNDETGTTSTTSSPPRRPPLSPRPTEPATTTASSTPSLDMPPPGWETVVREGDGRIYYFEVATGKTSWTHPLAATPGKIDDRRQAERTYWNRRRLELRRPDSLRCYAFSALLLCPPLGVWALYHSYHVDKSWRAGDPQRAMRHNRQANRFACAASFLGISFWLFWLVIREEGKWHLGLDFSTADLNRTRN